MMRSRAGGPCWPLGSKERTAQWWTKYALRRSCPSLLSTLSQHWGNSRKEPWWKPTSIETTNIGDTFSLADSSGVVKRNTGAGDPAAASLCGVPLPATRPRCCHLSGTGLHKFALNCEFPAAARSAVVVRQTGRRSAGTGRGNGDLNAIHGY